VAAGKAPDFVLVRWIGDDKHGPEGDRELQVLRDAELAQWAERIAALHAAGCSIFGYMHNPYEGHAPASVRRLQALVQDRVTLPPWPPAPSGGQLTLL
jgi:uncharacterized protein YecE (DUF72 family)